MDDETKIMHRYYDSFMSWLGFVKPNFRMALRFGQMDAEQLKPILREWAEDICVDRPTEPTNVI